MQTQYDVIVIGGGAAGFFSAIRLKELQPNLNVVIFEKTHKLLTKVLVSGGGRCNVTHASESIAQLSKAYPRGKYFLKKSFNDFWVPQVIAWFAKEGITLKTEEDGRMFPQSNSSETIANCFLQRAHDLNIEIKTGYEVKEIEKIENGFSVSTNQGDFIANRIILASGGHQKISQFDYLSSLNLDITALCPSLFTFNLPKNAIISLMGLVAKDVTVGLSINSPTSVKLQNRGPLLITHWGMSGPAIIVLSSLAARELAAVNYNFNFYVDWLPKMNYEQLQAFFEDNKTSNKQIKNLNFIDGEAEGLPDRLWLYMLAYLNIDSSKTVAQLSKTDINRMIDLLKHQTFEAKGKTTFKEEFVTCGGISLEEVNSNTMAAKKHQGLYFCGEVLDIDAITGGYNFQSAWTTAAIVANTINNELCIKN